jgi:signal transduction histidine kinase
MSFTHDLKTSLASVQLQAEGLREDWPEGTAREGLDRLLGDTVRLQIQLENSLFVAQPDGRLLSERVDVAAAVERHGADWPALVVEVDGRGNVLADARAFDIVIRNLLQNAVVHGSATRVRVTVAQGGDGMIRVTISDNGRGLPVEALSRVGRPFSRPSATSGTGVGLYVSRMLVSRMRGSLTLLDAAGPDGGLRVAIDLPEAR